ncbi:MAG: hypothetical protein EPO10_07770, partial [Reyranella sp.]
MPPSSAVARSFALAVVGVGAASFAAHGQNVTAFNPYSGAGLTGGPLPQYTSPPGGPAVDAAGPPGPVAGPAFNPWSSPAPALASREAAPPQTHRPAPQTKAGASLPPPPPGPIRSRVVAVPELTTSRSKPRDIAKASAAYVEPAVKPASTPTVPPVVAAPVAVPPAQAQAPVPAAAVPATPVPATPPAAAATPAAPSPVAAAPASVRSAPAPTNAPTAPGLTAPAPPD